MKKYTLALVALFAAQAAQAAQAMSKEERVRINAQVNQIVQQINRIQQTAAPVGARVGMRRETVDTGQITTLANRAYNIIRQKPGISADLARQVSTAVINKITPNLIDADVAALQTLALRLIRYPQLARFANALTRQLALRIKAQELNYFRGDLDNIRNSFNQITDTAGTAGGLIGVVNAMLANKNWLTRANIRTLLGNANTRNSVSGAIDLIERVTEGIQDIIAKFKQLTPAEKQVWKQVIVTPEIFAKIQEYLDVVARFVTPVGNAFATAVQAAGLGRRTTFLRNQVLNPLNTAIADLRAQFAAFKNLR